MFTITFSTDNDAFHGGFTGDGAMHAECAAILRRLANHIEDGIYDSGNVRDSNGNTVGNWSLTKEDE